LRWPRDTLYPLKLALTSPTSGGRSVGIVRWQTKAPQFDTHLWARWLPHMQESVAKITLTSTQHT
jgi:hypothetical protein